MTPVKDEAAAPTEKLPREGSLLPESWLDFVIELAKYDDFSVPQEAQDTVYALTDEPHERALGIGRHPKHGYFLIEVHDRGNSPEYFLGWWDLLKETMAPTTPVAILDVYLARILRCPGMHAPTIVALEFVLWALLQLRGHLHPRQLKRDGRLPAAIARQYYFQLTAKAGCPGPGGAAQHFQKQHGDALPEGQSEVRRFYRKWVGLTCHHQDSFPEPAIHVLNEGLPLCGFTTRPPCNWHPAHLWVPPASSDDATCDACKSKLPTDTPERG